VSTLALVREASPDDARDIARAHRESRAAYCGSALTETGDDRREAMWSELLADGSRVTHVAELSGLVVGFISVARVPIHADALELTALYVLPSHFGTGIGGMLYRQFEAERRPGPSDYWENIGSLD
jgi:predicted N-acetyltransferase YhbS